MRRTLKSSSWKATAEKIRKCHLSTLQNEPVNVQQWEEAFESLIDSIHAERKYNPTFATELCYLTIDSGFSYDLMDVLEEYFDVLEAQGAWTSVLKSTKTLLDTFAWNNFTPSEYKYRYGNALMKSGRIKEAESFGKRWVRDYPRDLFAAASYSFLLFSEGKKKEAQAIAAKFLDPNLVCTDATETLFNAALSLYDATEDKTAKRIIEQKIADFNAMAAKEGK